MGQIKLIISDLDGTLFDTKEANRQAYEKAFKLSGVTFDENIYNNSFGLRFDEMMDNQGIHDPFIRKQIQVSKKELYPLFFKFIRLNNSLLSILMSFKENGGIIALASTAQKNNIENILQHFNIENLFNLIISGNEIKFSKPNPECYNLIIKHFNLTSDETLIFEDSDVGIQAANAAGCSYIVINQNYFL